MIISKKPLTVVLSIFLWLTKLSAQTAYESDSIKRYLIGSWKVEVLKYFDGARDGITRDVSFSEKFLQVYETAEGMRKLKYNGELRIDSLDDGTPVIYAYLDKNTSSSNCNTLLFQVHAETEDSMTVQWFELYYLREEEKTNYYFANCRFSRILE